MRLLPVHNDSRVADLVGHPGCFCHLHIRAARADRGPALSNELSLSSSKDQIQSLE